MIIRLEEDTAFRTNVELAANRSLAALNVIGNVLVVDQRPGKGFLVSLRLSALTQLTIVRM